MRRPHIVMDTEYTAWEGSWQRKWSAPGERREIVQIAALKIGADGRESDRFVRYVKPIFNPLLSDYFISLTGITQEKVDSEGIDFLDAMFEYRDFAEGHHSWCYGRDDEIVAENAGWFGAKFDMPAFMDARPLVAMAGHDPSEWSSGTVHRLVGVERPGSREHDALDDCLSLSAFIEGMRREYTGPNPKRTAA